MGVAMVTSANNLGPALGKASGVAFIHSAPKAMSTHIEWSLGRLLGAAVHLDWLDQPVAPGTVRSELSWAGYPELSTEIASTLRAYPNLRFEITEEPSAGFDGQRIVSTPTLGIWRSPMGVYGDVLIPEDKLRSAISGALNSGNSILEVIETVLGTPWDRELEPFRFAGEGVPVRWLHQVS
jgi:hypothetical protein